MTGRRRDALVRAYVVTGGRSRPDRRSVDPATLVEAITRRTVPGLDPDQRRVVDLCRGGALSVAEIAAHACLPLTAAVVVVGDLITARHLTTRHVAPAEAPSTELMREVLDGLRRLAV